MRCGYVKIAILPGRITGTTITIGTKHKYLGHGYPRGRPDLQYLSHQDKTNRKNGRKNVLGKNIIETLVILGNCFLTCQRAKERVIRLPLLSL